MPNLKDYFFYEDQTEEELGQTEGELDLKEEESFKKNVGQPNKKVTKMPVKKKNQDKKIENLNNNSIENSPIMNVIIGFLILTVIGVVMRGCTGLITGEGFGVGLEEHMGMLTIFGLIFLISIPFLILYFLKDKF